MVALAGAQMLDAGALSRGMPRVSSRDTWILVAQLVQVPFWYRYSPQQKLRRDTFQAHAHTILLCGPLGLWVGVLGSVLLHRLGFGLRRFQAFCGEGAAAWSVGRPVLDAGKTRFLLQFHRTTWEPKPPFRSRPSQNNHSLKTNLPKELLLGRRLFGSGAFMAQGFSCFVHEKAL